MTKQAAIETAPETMLISSESASVKPASCHSVDAVIEDDVDADELLEHRQHDADPDDLAHAEEAAAACRGQHVRKARAVIGAEARLDLLRAWRALTVVAEQAGQHAGGMIVRGPWRPGSAGFPG